MSQHFSNFGCVLSLIVTFKFQLYPHLLSVKPQWLCPARAQPRTHLGPEENHKHVSAPPCIASFSQLPSCTNSRHFSESKLTSLTSQLTSTSVLSLDSCSVSRNTPPRQKSGRTWFLFCAFLLSEGSQNCTAWYSMPQTGIVKNKKKPQTGVNH